MTKTIKINCHAWWIRIGISLWVLTTVGLGYSIYYDYVLVYPHDTAQILEHCKNLPSGWKEDCIIKNLAPQDPSGLYLSLLLNACNFVGMWIVINNKYKFIEIKCFDKQSVMTNDSNNTNRLMSNNEYFKQKESS